LASNIDPERLGFSWSGYAGDRPILGKLRDTKFRLQKRRYYRNSFAPFFFGRFVATGSGTRIEGGFRIHPLMRVFVIVWVSFTAICCGIMMAGAISGRSDSPRDQVMGA
jgi:hypothetical protein